MNKELKKKLILASLGDDCFKCGIYPECESALGRTCIFEAKTIMGKKYDGDDDEQETLSYNRNNRLDNKRYPDRI